MNQVSQDLFNRFRPAEVKSSKRLKVAVAGGGPSGLLLVWKLLNGGAIVSVFEKRGVYKLDQATDARSYNVTADALGLRSFGRLGNLIYGAGTIVDGRAIHSLSGACWTHPYGHRPSDLLVSVPRGDLLALLTGTILGHPQCTLNFDCEVVDADPTTGTVRWKSMADQSQHELTGLDLIVFADGVHGLGQRKAKGQPGVSATSESRTPYLNLTVSEDAVKRSKLELDKIHFFPAPDDESLGIGLPNFNGTISLLIEAQVHTNHKGEEIWLFTGQTPFSPYSSVFTKREDADRYLQAQNPQLADVLKDLPDEQILNKRPNYFYESFINSWRIGRMGVLVGDAGSCAPPWAGFGMNLACSHAADLAELITQSTDLEAALKLYNKRRQKCTDVVKRVIREHGALLNSGIGSQRWRREQAIRDQRERTLGERSEYQIVAFDEQGLEELAGLA
ncbi:FAD-dependent oxidoreductase [Mycobacterium montefiorense]|uniref:FAD-dependent oxidoreductase n=1 Tax=Mycobacterium montefiorense TaxID=154654 RepID=UPI0021F2993B|nr:FAD-dependent monooxygenase [Mycobacterium montefiorense]MCV7425114.1 FAD-dependent monooxygenase [Mycobacterium montefiorense]